MANEGLTLLRNLWYTALTADVSASATTLNVVSTTNLPSPGIVICGYESIYFTGKTATTITGCTRGFDNTTAATHAKGATVGQAMVAAHHNDLVAAVVAVGAGVNQVVAATATTSGPTTTSSSFSTIAEMSRTITTTVGTKLLVAFDASIYNSGAGNLQQFGVALDGAAEVSVRTVYQPTASQNQIVSLHHLFTGVSIGAHTVTARWLTTAGTLTASGVQRDLIVTECP